MGRHDLGDFPFHFTQQTVQQVETAESTYCKFLSRRGLHKKGLWKADCPCHQGCYGSANFDVTTPISNTQVQASVPPRLTCWQDYYSLKNLSYDDPVALLLDMPMSLMWAVQQARAVFCNCDLSFNNIVIHYLGAQKEVHQWPVFQSLLDTMPGSVHIHFFSPDMPDHLEGLSKRISVQQGSSASWLCADTTALANKADSSSAAAATHVQVQQQQVAFLGSTQSETCSAAASTSHCHAVPHMASRVQQEASLPLGGAAAQADMTRDTNTAPTLQLTFHKGLYHDVIAGANGEVASADLVFGANAGLAAYPSWVPTLQLLSHEGSPPAVFTDFCEEAAVQGMRVMQAVVEGPMQWMPVGINPFRKPLSCQSRDNNLPSFSNAFVFGMAPQAVI